MLMHQLTLALRHTSAVLQHKSLVHHPLKVLKVSSLQSIGQPFIQAIQETLMFLLISVNFMRSIARQLSKLGDVLIHRHGPLFQILKLLLLQLNNSLGNMMCIEKSSEFWLVDALRFLMGFHISIPPVGCRTRKFVRGWQHLVMVVALHHLQLLLNRLEPIINIHWLHSMRKGRWRSALKISKPIPQRRWRCLRLSSLHVDEGLLHSLKHLCLHSQHLLKSRRRGWRWIDIPVVLSIVVPVVFVAVPCVGHLKYKR
jgi:hypothetical protein